MNMAEVAQAAYAAGIRDVTNLGRAVAVAFAESGGNPRAHNPRPPDDSYGLWQINMLGGLGPARRQQFGLSSNDQLFDPATNAKAMYAISGGGTNWKPWTTYGGIRYLALLPAANAAAAGIVAGNPIVDGAKEAASSVTEPVTAAADSLLKAGSWLSDRNNWFRIGKVGIGAVLVAVGLSNIGRGYAARTVAPIVGAVAPVGKAVKAVGGMSK